MKLSVTAPAEDMPDYLHTVADQLGSGYSSGYVDAEMHWEVYQR